MWQGRIVENISRLANAENVFSGPLLEDRGETNTQKWPKYGKYYDNQGLQGLQLNTPLPGMRTHISLTSDNQVFHTGNSHYKLTQAPRPTRWSVPHKS